VLRYCQFVTELLCAFRSCIRCLPSTCEYLLSIFIVKVHCTFSAVSDSHLRAKSNLDIIAFTVLSMTLQCVLRVFDFEINCSAFHGKNGDPRRK